MIVAVALAAAVLFAGSPGRARRRRRRQADGDETLLFVELVALGVSSGLSFAQAAALAVADLGGPVAAEATKRIRGVETIGPLGGIFSVAERSSLTGAALLPALDGHIAELRATLRQKRLERIRKLPVKLLFPLALLVLPGFLLLTVGPVVAGSLERLGL